MDRRIIEMLQVAGATVGSFWFLNESNAISSHSNVTVKGYDDQGIWIGYDAGGTPVQHYVPWTRVVLLNSITGV